MSDNSNLKFEAKPHEFTCMTWNIEGFIRSKHSLKTFVDQTKPDLILLSEPMLFQCDLQQNALLFEDYSAALSSEDLYDTEIPYRKRRAYGGTMFLWKSAFDPYVTQIPFSSPSILSILFSPPEVQPSIHIAVYLPTAGRDKEFVEEVSGLHHHLAEITVKYLNIPVFLRGDFNVNPKDKMRCSVVQSLMNEFKLISTPINHTTYHHFTGEGSSDSQLDILMHTVGSDEVLVKLYCKLDEPEIISHHDLIISKFIAPLSDSETTDAADVDAPRIPNKRVIIKWSDEGIMSYSLCVNAILSRLRNSWLDSTSEASISVLLQSTNAIMNYCAMSTNKHIDTSIQRKFQSSQKPRSILSSKNRVRRTYMRLKKTAITSQHYLELRDVHRRALKEHKRCIRLNQRQEERKRDSLLENINSSNSSLAYRKLKHLRSTHVRKISRLQVGSKTFSIERVPDGIFSSIHDLKMEPEIQQSNGQDFPDFNEEYRLILDICQSGRELPEISMEKSNDILCSLKKHVNDFYSITSLHYLNAGHAGLEHFFFILRSIIRNINLSRLDELNTIFACVLYKGHGKSREEARSYRTISTCPLIAKALDLYVRDLCLNEWNNVQAPSQFQGPHMSHDLASLLLTETVNFSLNVSKKPVFALFLDARSAFDRVLNKILIRNMYLAGTNDHRLIYMNNRLSNRKTFLEFDKQVMGPINDMRGLEQGGCYSSEAYKLYNNEQACAAQHSNLGVNLYDECISCISLADDTVLLSTSLLNLILLLRLTLVYCSKYDVELVPDKTNLIVFSNKINDVELDYMKHSLPVILNHQQIFFSEEAVHLGVMRSASVSNMPHILSRLSAHRRTLFSVLPAGTARRHNANPAAGLKIESIYALPVLLSGLSTLVLKKAELDIVWRHYKNSLKRIMKLPEDCSDCAIFFLAGSLPSTAFLHLRILSLFGMICHLPGNLLHRIGLSALTLARPSAKSWFVMVRNLCIQYDLPHPLILLEYPISSLQFKSMCKLKVREYWHKFLSDRSRNLALPYLKVDFLTLTRPHPIWTSVDPGNSYQVKGAVIQATFLSGRYRTERLKRHWSQSNPNGFCIMDSCNNLKLYDTIEHVLLQCPGLTDERRRLESFTYQYIKQQPLVQEIVLSYLFSDNIYDRCQFLLNCSVLPLVIRATQDHGYDIHHHCFRISRTWCRSLHLARLKKLGRFVSC